jgi:prepilin-type N-terminal cleavage/methylation domain-containing protein
MIWPSDTRNRRQGFSLLEAMLALAVLALVLGTALGGIGWTVGQMGQRSDAAWGTELARSVLDEYSVTRDAALAEGRAAPDWRWELTVSSGGERLQEATVRVWRAGSRERAVVLRALLPEDAP